MTDNDIFDDNGPEDGTEDDDDTEAQKIEAAEDAGDTVAAVLYLPIKLTLAFFAKMLIGVSRRIPGRTRIQKGLIKSGIEGLWKTTDANLIVMTIYGDGVVIPRPAQVNSDEAKSKRPTAKSGRSPISRLSASAKRRSPSASRTITNSRACCGSRCRSS